MDIYETFSKRRKRRERAGQPDVYQYDDLPDALRVQIIHIWNSAIGPTSAKNGRPTGSGVVWQSIDDTLSREMGVFYLGGDRQAGYESRCKQFLRTASTEHALDMIEFSFRCIERIPQVLNLHQTAITQHAGDAIAELNYRFREHGVGYQFEGCEIVRVDSQYVHSEVVKPAIALLNTAGFEGASDEFLKAHEHYRKGRHGEAMTEALKAFESTMKAICDKNGWTYDSHAPAKRLIEAILDNELVPRYMQSHFTGLRQTLEAGLPTVRNKNSGHGQGLLARKVPDYFAGYALHLAATNIVFLVEAHEALHQN